MSKRGRVILVVLVAISLINGVHSQTFGIAIYQPDFMAMRSMTDAVGEFAAPNKPQYAELINAWNSITPKARQFLVREHDLAVVIVSPDGNWLFRSSGTAELHSIYGPGERLSAGDLSALNKTLGNRYFIALRDFHRGKLEPGNQIVMQKSMESALALAASGPTSGPDADSWFLGIIGGEFSALDESVKQSILKNPVYSPTLNRALIVAEVARNEQLARISSSQTGNGSAVIHYQPEKWMNAFSRRIENSISHQVDGKPIYEITVDGGSVYIASKSNAVIAPDSIKGKNISELIDSDKVNVYVAVTGSSKVVQVSTIK